MAYKLDPVAMISNAHKAQEENFAQQNKKKPTTVAPVVTAAPVVTNPATAIANAIAAQNQNAVQQQQIYDPNQQQRIYDQYVAAHPAVGQTGGATGGTAAGTASSTALADRIAAILKNAYDQNIAANQTQYDNSVNAMKSAYASGEKSVNEAAKAALREAYISQMQARRTMPQQLSALGVHGGMSETTAASLMNNYADNRNIIEANRMAELGTLNDTLLQNIYAAGNQLAAQNAAANQSYYQQLAEQAIANETPQIKVQEVAYDYRTDPAYFAQLSEVINGKVNKETIAANFEALATKYGLAGAESLLSAAK